MADLPAGDATEVRIGMCNGDDIEVTRIVEVANMVELSETDGTVQSVFIIVKGHPHLDETTLVLRGVARDADEQLRRWTE